jgi:hypothetical protein
LPKFSPSWERGTDGEENLRVSKEVAWTLDDGAKVWITEAEQPLPFDRGWRW